MRAFRVGLIGAGYVSSYHIRALERLQNVEVVGITDLDPSRGTETASQFGLRFFKSTDEMYSVNPDVVHVLTPPNSHCKVTLEALEKSCHVFVEKPMAASEEECELMIRKAAEARRILSVDHSAKFDPVVQKSLRLVKKGAIGELLSIDYLRCSEYPPYQGGPVPLCFKKGGYPFRDIGVHALYLMEAFLGEIEKLDVRYRTSGLDSHLLLDEWSGLVHCKKGTGQFRLSWTSRPMQHLLAIHGTKGSILLDLYLETCLLQRSLPLPKPVEAIINTTLAACSSIVQVLKNSVNVATGRAVRGPDIHRAIHEFYTALSNSEPPPISPIEGKRMVGWVEKVAQEGDSYKEQLSTIPPARKPASVLVTGGSGFLGRQLVRSLLSSGEHVRLLVRRNSVTETHPLLDVITGDLGDPETVDRAVHGVNIVYHVGAATGGAWFDYECGTIWGTKNIVDSCLRHGIKKLVYVSSLSVLQYAGLPSRALLDESSCLEQSPEKRGYYANSKLEAEKVVIRAINESGLRAVVLRPGSIFGPGAEKVPPYGVVALGRRWIVMGNGNVLLPLVHVEDVVDALRKSAEIDMATGKIIQLVDPDQITQREYLRYVQMNTREIKVYHAPMFILYCCAAVLQVMGALSRRAVPLTFYRLRSIRPHLKFSNERGSQILRWTPRVGIQNGLEQTFNPNPFHPLATATMQDKF